MKIKSNEKKIGNADETDEDLQANFSAAQKSSVLGRMRVGRSGADPKMAGGSRIS